ncbi:protein FAM210B, mitochondrial [Gasterosteus aculeatus]
MFLCLSAAAHAPKSPGSFLGASSRGDVTLRKGHALPRYRCFCVSVRAGDANGVRLGKQQQQQQQQKPPVRRPVEDRDSCLRPLAWGHWDRMADKHADLWRRVRGGGAGHADMIAPRLVRANGGGLPAPGLFTGDWGGLGGLCSAGTMHTRGFSTKRSDGGEEHTANHKGEFKEASSTSPSAATLPGEPQPEGGKPNKTQQLKKVFKEYGAVGVSFHIGISLMSLGMFYLLISSGIDMAAVLCKVGFSEAVVQSKMAAGTSTFVLAYAIHKLFAPVRISITLVSVPLIVRHFRKTGHFKPPTPAP